MNAEPREPPIYRPFALLAFGAALLVGMPIGLRLLAWLYAGWPAVGVEWRLLHAHVQVFGFFATLIPGVAQHLIARFTGRPVCRTRLGDWLVVVLGAALALRVVGTAADAAVALLIAACLQAAAYVAFGALVWRSLDPPPLALVRRHLTLATGWLALATAVEVAARAHALVVGLAVPLDAAMRAVHAIGLVGVIGWVLGVLLRAGPMFVPGWAVPVALGRAVPWGLAVAVALTVAGELGGGTAATSVMLARLADTLVLAVVAAVALAAGALGRTGAALPVIGRGGPESRIFRVAVGSAMVAAVSYVVTVWLASRGADAHLVTDAARHLVTVGFVSGIVVAMSFRLIVALEGRALRWPGLRDVAFWTLLGAVVLRTAEVAVGYVWPGLAPLVAVSGVLAWLALASVAANLAAAALGGRGRAT